MAARLTRPLAIGRHVNGSTTSKMTVTRLVLTAVVTSLTIMAILVVIAVVALLSVTTAKDEVIEQDVRSVVDAYRLDYAVAERGVAVRNLLLTGDESHLARLIEVDGVYEEALASLSASVRSPEGQRLLEEITDAKEELNRETEVVLEDWRRAGGLGADVRALVDDRLSPARQAVTTAAVELTERQEERIAAAVARSDATASNAIRLLVGLGVLGVILALVVGAKVTQVVSRRLTGLALSVDSAAAEILAGTAQQVAGASQQAAAVQETVTTTDELAQTAEQSAERARTVASRAQRSAEVAAQGTGAVGDSAAAMEEIRSQVESIAGTVLSLSEHAQAVSGIVRSVEDIADQTHLLALNAAIEAARAGEHGHGFGVVAGEVRALADQSKRATVQIAEILGRIQQGTNSAVMATEEGSKSVAHGIERVGITGSTIEELAETVSSSAIAAEQISASSGQQAVATAQISQAMRDLDDVTQQSASAARQAEQAARDLNSVAAELKALVGAR